MPLSLRLLNTAVRVCSIIVIICTRTYIIADLHIFNKLLSPSCCWRLRRQYRVRTRRKPSSGLAETRILCRQSADNGYQEAVSKMDSSACGGLVLDAPESELMNDPSIVENSRSFQNGRVMHMGALAEHTCINIRYDMIALTTF